ncbi:MAG: hypothetical protein FVQ77_12700 [Cytophagales bacterium]|nr:hypothetical protein [Cytophagales bacterium]
MVNKTEGEEAIEKEITHLMNMNYSIHYNVWRQIDLLDFFVKLKQDMEFQFNIELVFQRDQRENEVVVILKKN